MAGKGKMFLKATKDSYDLIRLGFYKGWLESSETDDEDDDYDDDDN